MAESIRTERDDGIYENSVDDGVRRIKVIGGGGVGKTEAIVDEVKYLLSEGVDPADIAVFVSTLSAADELASRLGVADVRAVDIRVGTVASYCVEILSSEEARAATGRIPRLLADFEERILMEDMKVVGLKVKRLREMLKFFYREWTELGDEREDFLIDAEEKVVHGAIKEHLRMRGAMLVYELSNLTCRFLRDHAASAQSWQRVHVLVDDFQNLNKASQMVLEVLAGKTLMVCGNENEQVPTPEPFPYAQGFTDFEHMHPNVEVLEYRRGMRCPQQIMAMANSLVVRGGLDRRTLVDLDPEGDQGEVHLVKWPLPNDEFMGIARSIKHRLEDATHPIHPCEIFVAVPNALWGRALSKVLQANAIKADVVTSYHTLGGDPRVWDKCAGLRAFTALNLIAAPTDVAAWRTWCGFGDYLTHSNHWCRLEDYARERGLSVLDVLADIENRAEQAFLGADVLAERFRQGRTLIERAQDRHGFALLNTLKDTPASEVPSDFMALLEPVWGTESAEDLLARARGRLENRFAGMDAVRIGLLQMACGLSFDTIILMGAVEGFYPAFETLDISCDDERRDCVRAQERRLWYSTLTKSCHAVIISCFQKDESDAATAWGMWAHRIRVENGKSMAVLAPSSYIDELGDGAPGFESDLA